MSYRSSVTFSSIIAHLKADKPLDPKTLLIEIFQLQDEVVNSENRYETEVSRAKAETAEFRGKYGLLDAIAERRAIYLFWLWLTNVALTIAVIFLSIKMVVP